MWLALAAITLLGAFLRLIRLGGVPPGLHYDEAVYGLQAIDILHGLRPVFFSSYTGREPLYMYLMAVVFRLIGPGELGIRLTSALVGIATIPLVFLALRELLCERPSANRVALLAAAYVATSYWHLTVSRNGYPNILIPPIECLAIYFLWRGYRDGRLLASLVGGLFTGLVLYTYLAARFFPVTLVLFFAHVLIVDWRRLWSRRALRAAGLALAALAAVALFAPLGLYFLRHPADFWERANQVLVFRQTSGPEIAMTLLRNMAQTLGGLALRGDPRSHFNLPGKPILSPVSALFFLVGLGAVLRKWRRPEYMLLPIWVVGMCLPAVLTSAEMPQGQRMFGIVPAAYGLVALGLDVCWGAVENRRGWLTRALPAVVGALLLAEAGVTAHTYLSIWPRQAETYYNSHADHDLLAERARAALDNGQELVILAREYKHPGVVLYDPRTVDATWISGGRTFVLPHRPQQSTLYLWTAQTRTLDPALDAVVIRTAETIEEILGPDGRAALRIMRPRPAALAEAQSAVSQASFAHEIELLHWSVLDTDPDGRHPRNRPLRALVAWRVRAPGRAEHLALHLVDGQGVRWAQSDQMGYFRENWEPGDVVYQVFEVELPEGIPAGDHELRLVMSTSDGGLVPVVRSGALSGVHLALGNIALKGSGPTLRALGDAQVRFGPEIALIAHDPIDRSERLGGHLDVRLTWQAWQAPSANHLVEIALVGPDGVVALAHQAPLAGQYPTIEWRQGEIVRAVHRLLLTDLEAGAYAVKLWVEGERETAYLGQVRIEGGARTFEAPEITHPLHARLGDEIELLGYDLDAEPYRPGDQATLKLYWRATSTPTRDGKVFVHLVDSAGQIRAQHDAAPANWERPTLGWAEGEVVLDEHPLTIDRAAPPGDYVLYVGLYDSATLQRLPVLAGDQAHVAEDRLLIAQIAVAP